MQPFDFQLKTRLIFGPGTLSQLGELSRELGFRRPLLVADPGLQSSGHVDRAIAELVSVGIDASSFHDFDINPDTGMIERGTAFAKPLSIDSIIGLGGGSSLDCAKGINFLLTNGGSMSDYQGYGRSRLPMLPMIAVPTTAGTGSEAQSYAVISDKKTHLKMACGAPGAAFRIAVLDTELTLSQPASVTAASGFDAIAHAVETAVTTRGTIMSSKCSREAFRLLNENYEQVLKEPDNLKSREAMQLGAFYAGAAIEHSMLGAAHACANPLTAHFQITHGIALSILLPHVVQWNSAVDSQLYRGLVSAEPEENDVVLSGDQLAARLIEMSRAGGFPKRLRDVGVSKDSLEIMAEAAVQQWTARFNPRPLTTLEALEIYRCAY